MTEKRLLPLSEVTRLTGLKRTAIHERMARNDFPRPVKLGETTTRWVLAEVEAWIDRKVQDRDQGAGPSSAAA